MKFVDGNVFNWFLIDLNCIYVVFAYIPRQFIPNHRHFLDDLSKSTKVKFLRSKCDPRWTRWRRVTLLFSDVTTKSMSTPCHCGCPSFHYQLVQLFGFQMLVYAQVEIPPKAVVPRTPQREGLPEPVAPPVQAALGNGCLCWMDGPAGQLVHACICLWVQKWMEMYGNYRWTHVDSYICIDSCCVRCALNSTTLHPSTVKTLAEDMSDSVAYDCIMCCIPDFLWCILFEAPPHHVAAMLIVLPILPAWNLTSCLLYMATDMTVWYQSDNVWHLSWKIRVQRTSGYQRVAFSAFCCTRGLCRRQADSQWDGGCWSTKSFKDSEVHCVGVFGQMSDSHGWSIDNEDDLKCYWITFDEHVWIKNPDQMPSSDASNHELGSGPCSYPEVWVVVKRNGPHHQQVNKLHWLRGNSLDGINLPSQGEAGTRAEGRRVGTWDEGSCDL